MTPQPDCLDAYELYIPPEAIPLAVEVRVPNEYGGHYIRHKRWRTYGEVFTDCHKHMNVRVCGLCQHEWSERFDAWKKPCPNCQQMEHAALIDEYDSGPGKNGMAQVEIGLPGERLKEIACFAHVGGNEGYYANLSAVFADGSNNLRHVPLYWIKSFQGMRHVHKLVARLMVGTGVWPSHGEQP